MKKAVFLDRDGVLMEDAGYPHRPEHMHVLPGAKEAVARLRNAGYFLVVVSNQSGVARGYFSEADVKTLNRKLGEALGIDHFYYCPHYPKAKGSYGIECNCRKPKPGMLLRAAKEHNIALADSWMIGDKLDDAKAGKAAGCRAVVIGSGRGAGNLAEAVDLIFETETSGKLVSLDKLRKIIRMKKGKIVFTNGCFDLLHAGHVDYLGKARALGSALVVGLNSDFSVKRIKGPSRPVNPEFQRAKVLSGLGCVDYVTIFNENTPVALVEKLKPDVYAKGGDWKLDELPERKIVEKYGGKVALIDVIEDESTTKMIERISASQKR